MCVQILKKQQCQFYEKMHYEPFFLFAIIVFTVAINALEITLARYQAT